MKELPALPAINYAYWILQTLAMMVTGWIVPGLKVVNPLGAVLMVVGLAFVNAHVWDAALFFEIPDSLTTRTLALLVANGLIFWVLVKVLPWIEISGCLAPVLAPVVFTIFSVLIAQYGQHIDWIKAGEGVLHFLNQFKQGLMESKPGQKTEVLRAILSV